MTTSQFTTVDPSFQSEERTRSYYRWRAGGYDKVTTYEIEHHREAIQLADIQPGDRVLEVACGTGRATVELASRLGADGRLDALDLSEAMLGHAQRKVAERGLLNKVELKIGSAQVLPYWYRWVVRDPNGAQRRAWLAHFIEGRDGLYHTIVSQPEEEWSASHLEIYFEDVNDDGVDEDVIYEVPIAPYLPTQVP